MKSNYAKKLNKFNMILGFHAAFKLVIILILFVVLNTSIWIKEKYLVYVKASVYIQIFVFLALSIVMLVLNNPHSMGICSNFINYFYLVASILEFIVIFLELYAMIANLHYFLISFHECPYTRTYEDIADLDFKRSCLYYSIDNNNELPYKYICYYNSEYEYFNSFCDGLICKKNNNKNEINSLVKCYNNIDKNNIRFPLDNEFYLKEFELIYKYKSSNLYACFRKNKVKENNNIFNKNCPDSNPIKRMLIFIYLDLIIHLLIDFLFIYEFITIKKLKQIYSNLVLLKNINQANILTNEDVMNIQNYFNKPNTNNNISKKYDINSSSQNKNENSEKIKIPGYKNSEIDEIKNNNTDIDDNMTDINKSTGNQNYPYDNILVHQDEDKNFEKNENDIIDRKKLKKKEEKNKINNNRRDSKQQMINMDKEEENEINKNIKNKNNNYLIDEIIDRNNDKKIKNNYYNIKITKENNIQIINNNSNKSKNHNLKSSKSKTKNLNSLNPLIEDNINKNAYTNKEKQLIDKQNENNNIEGKKNDLIENNIKINKTTYDNTNKNENKLNYIKNDLINEEHKNRKEKSKDYKERLNNKKNYLGEEKVSDDKINNMDTKGN